MSQQPVGAAMWGGQLPPSEQGRRPTAVPDDDDPRKGLPLKGGPPLADVASVILVTIAAVLIPLGAALEWGAGGALLAGGIVALILGILLTVGGDS